MDLIFFLGRFHVLALHIPIGIIIAIFVLEWLARKDKYRHLEAASGFLRMTAAVSAILTEYGDIAAVMEVFGIKRVAGYTVRKYLTKALTVERAAKVHRVPLEEFLATLRTATDQIGTGD